MTSFTVLNFFDEAVPLVLTIQGVQYLPPNDERPPALVFRVTLTELDKDLEEIDIHDVNPDAWFKMMVRPHLDGDIGKFRTKVTSILQALSLEIPVGESLQDFLRLSAASILNLVNARFKDDELVLPKLYAHATTVKGRPRMVTVESGKRVMSHDARFVNAMYIDREMSLWLNN